MRGFIFDVDTGRLSEVKALEEERCCLTIAAKLNAGLGTRSARPLAKHLEKGW